MENECTDITSYLKQLQPNTSKNLQHYVSPSQRDIDTPTAQEPVHAGARMTLANNKCPGDSQNQIEYPKTEADTAQPCKGKTSQTCRATRQASDNPQSQQWRLANQAKTERTTKEGQLLQPSRTEEPAKIQQHINAKQRIHADTAHP
ncbi:hypothetical protein H0E87_031703 [Populus deltoides]|uniref:Uncharacterized protein n=1 Tax=Populus deltoides TaxID=3696 RepID=A0A8T2WGU1_POPDE|nr:hypothetical protein H0E87_031703 [Populus deltoides]